MIDADCCLRELSRRLIGVRPGVRDLNESLSASTPMQAVVWQGVSRYLQERIQSTPDEMPGRAPDMSEAAAAAMRSVLAELGAPGLNTDVGGDLQWKWKYCSE
mmetsp:Transcript_50452/g.131276  ORF Transcript_50452/g.131276 Transcript_50452/m.131276 type:complete len:103 (+) Transcript_50452:3-311(+)